MYKDLNASSFSEWIASTDRKSMHINQFSFATPSFANESTRQGLSLMKATRTVRKGQNP